MLLCVCVCFHSHVIVYAKKSITLAHLKIHTRTHAPSPVYAKNNAIQFLCVRDFIKNIFIYKNAVPTGGDDRLQSHIHTHRTGAPMRVASFVKVTQEGHTHTPSLSLLYNVAYNIWYILCNHMISLSSAYFVLSV